MASDPRPDLVIAGAGIVGASTALWAVRAGLKVVICDPNPPGSGASYGNACSLATYGCLPVNSPSILRDLPGLLLRPEAPLRIDPAYALRHPRWMLSFLRACRPARVAEIEAALAAILAQADAGLDPLLDEAGARDLVVAQGVLNIWNTEAGWRAAARGLARREALGVALQRLTPDEVRALEPGLTLPLAGGVRFSGARHLRDPAALVGRLVAKACAMGATLRPAAVAQVCAKSDGVTLTLSDGQTLEAGKLAVCAGAHARSIRGVGLSRLPLDTERGYHVQFSHEAHRLTRPVGWAESGLYAVPMAQGLRFAGTVEIAGLKAPPNPRRLAMVRGAAERMMGPLSGPDSTWLGFRPTLPDSLPVIGPSPRSRHVLLGFGHQHLGLTLGGITGQMLADLASGHTPRLDLAPFSAARF